MKVKYKTWLELSSKAVEQNLQSLQKVLSSNIKVLAVVKGNAYGAGIEQFVPLASPYVAGFAVDTVAEAVRVRRIYTGTVLVIGYVLPDDFLVAARNDISVSISDLSQLNALARLSRKMGKKIKVHLEFDTGLKRLGFGIEDVAKVIKQTRQLTSIKVEGVYSHLSRIYNEQGLDVSASQVEKFNALLEKFKDAGLAPKFIHLSSSFAALLKPELRYDMVRLGIVVYGLFGYEETALIIRNAVPKLALQPVLSFHTRVVAIKTIQAGEGFGYRKHNGRNKRVVLAVLGVGFADGLDRRYSSCGKVLLKGRKVPFVGAMNMNMSFVEITSFETEVKVGDPVIVIGSDGKKAITWYDMAKTLHTSTYEVIAHMNSTVPRIVR